MKYKGRIVIAAVTIGLFIVARIYGNLYYNYPFLKFPFIGIIAFISTWWLGGKYDKVKFLSEKDVLTKIYNRRFIIQTFPKILALVKRKEENLSLSLLDVDNFKMINDTYGHETGDRVLQNISNLLLINIRKSETVARWAGDEFLIIAPGLNERSTELMIRRIHNELKKLSDEMSIEISISIGTSVYPKDGETVDDLFRVADQNMYKVKSQQKKNYQK